MQALDRLEAVTDVDPLGGKPGAAYRVRPSQMEGVLR